MTEPTFDDRLAVLEGAHARVPKIVHALYDDYVSIRQLLEDRQADLDKARAEETWTTRTHKDAKFVYDEEEAALLATDERAKGKNDTERKRNAAALISTERKTGKLKKLWDSLVASEIKSENATLEKEIAVDNLSSVRYVASMIAGLGRAIGGG